MFDLIEQVISLIHEMLVDWPVGTFLGLILTAAIALGALVIGLGVFRAIDGLLGTDHRGSGKVVGKEHVPARYSTMQVGAVTVPQHHSERWLLTVAVDGSYDSVSVGREAYNATRIGDVVGVEYTLGGFTGWPYVQQIYL